MVTVRIILFVLAWVRRRVRSPRVRPYASPRPYRAPVLPALPALVAPMYGPELEPVAHARPYVLDDLHRARRRRARRSGDDHARLGEAVLIGIAQEPTPVRSLRRLAAVA